MKFSKSSAKNKTEIRLPQIYFIFFSVVGTEPRALHTAGRYQCTTEVHLQSSLPNYFVMSNLIRKCLMKLEL